MSISKTVNRAALLKLAVAERLVALESYHFDDMTGTSRFKGSKPVRIIAPGQDVPEGIFRVFAFDFKSKSGGAWLNSNGSVTLDVHGNCNYTLGILCPCKKPQENNGLMAWCEDGHIEFLRKSDPRYSTE